MKTDDPGQEEGVPTGDQFCRYERLILPSATLGGSVSGDGATNTWKKLHPRTQFCKELGPNLAQLSEPKLAPKIEPTGEHIRQVKGLCWPRSCVWEQIWFRKQDQKLAQQFAKKGEQKFGKNREAGSSLTPTPRP